MYNKKRMGPNIELCGTLVVKKNGCLLICIDSVRINSL